MWWGLEGVEGLTAVEGIGEGAAEREGVMSLRVKRWNYGKNEVEGWGRGVKELALPTKDLSPIKALRALPVYPAFDYEK